MQTACRTFASAFRSRLGRPTWPDLLFLSTLGLLLVSGRHFFFYDPGTAWHWRLGHEILMKGSVPTADTFTLTRLGTPWVDQSWAYDAGLAYLVDRSGWTLAFFVSVVLIASIYSALLKGLLDDGRLVAPAVLATIGALLVGSIHFLVRPHLITIACTLAASRICQRQHDRNGGWPVFGIIPLVAVWANFHGGFLVGPLVVFTSAVGHAISGPLDARRLANVGRFLAAGFGSLLAPALNPYGFELYRHVFELLHSSDVTSLIQEYQPVPFGKAESRGVEWILLALIALPIVVGSRMTRYEGVHALVWLHLSLATMRHVPLFGIMAAPGIARLLEGCFMPEPNEPKRGTVWPGAAVIALGLPIVQGWSFAGFDSKVWPLTALPTLRTLPTSKPIFHEQDWGGLIEAADVVNRDGVPNLFDQTKPNRWSSSLGFDRTKPNWVAIGFDETKPNVRWHWSYSTSDAMSEPNHWSSTTSATQRNSHVSWQSQNQNEMAQAILFDQTKPNRWTSSLGFDRTKPNWVAIRFDETKPNRLAYVDDRFELFGKRFILEYVNAMEGGPDWDVIRDREGIAIVWVRPDRPLAKRLERDPEWTVRFRDPVSIVFERKTANDRLAERKPVRVGAFHCREACLGVILGALANQPVETVERVSSMSMSEGEESGMGVLACLNGELMPIEEAKVSVWDRGFLFADSIYEVFRLHSGRCWLETEHVNRLRNSLEALEFPEIDLDALMERVSRTVAASDVEEGTVYIQITRGVAPRLHAFPDPPVAPTELIVVRPYDDSAMAKLRETGVKIISHPDLRWGRCDVKSTNLLANVIANQAAKRAGAYEAVLFDNDEFVTEASHSSLLWLRRGKLQGTPEGPEILPGTTRILALRLAEAIGLPFEECRVTLDELLAADEVILLGTTIEVLSVVQIDDHLIQNGQPGPVSKNLQIAYLEAVRSWLNVESLA